MFKDFTFKRLVRYFFLLLSHRTMSATVRWKIVKRGGVDIKGPCLIYGGVGFDTVRPDLIHIGTGVRITSGTKILTHFFDPGQKGVHFKTGDVYIDDDVFIGMNVIICNSVRIGKGAVIGAGSIVTKDIPPYQVWAGNPAKFIRERTH